MQTLLQNYNITDILIILSLSAAAIKGMITFYDWAKDRIKDVFDKDYEQKNDKKQIAKKITEHDEIMNQLKANQEELKRSIQCLAKKIDRLIASDKDDIKSYIVQLHHMHCYELGWIDDQTLECCELRFSHYEKEGGNSYIKNLMDELRSLPRQKPRM